MRIPILRFGMVPVLEDPAFRSNFNRVCSALGYFLGTSVVGRSVASYGKLVTLLSQGQLDVAWVPPVVAMDCSANRIAKPRIAMVRQNETSYFSTLFVRDDSLIKSIADVRGVRAAWVNPDSASGYLVPLAILRARGISLSKAFSEQAFAGSHEAAARRVAAGDADIGANFAHFAAKDWHTPISSGWIEGKLDASFRILSVAGPIPTDVIVMHKTMSEDHRQEVIAAFSWVWERPEATIVQEIFHCEGFQPCDDDHLRGLRKLIRLLDRPSAC